MEGQSLIDAGTKQYFDHIDWSLWPETPEVRKTAAEKFSGILVEDGMTAEL